MSKNITIQEGGVAKQLTVAKLKTNLADSGTCLWVPEDEVTLGTKTITADGTYNASDDGYYGYSQVIVSGTGSVTGIDGDGDEATVTTDGGGNLVETKQPSSIVVTTPPTKTSYRDGETINYTGMVVKAYLKTGGLWTDVSHPSGTISNADLILPVTTADFSQAGNKHATSSIVSGDIPTASSVKFATKNMPAVGRTHTIQYSYSGLAIALKHDGSSSKLYILWASDSPGASVLYHVLNYWDDTGEYISNTYEQKATNHTYTYNDKTVYYGTVHSNFGYTVSDISLEDSPEISGEVAWTIVYGDIEGGSQEIPVQWYRPNGDRLETSFEIEVSE